MKKYRYYLMEQNLHRILAETLQLDGIDELKGRLDLTMNGLEEKSTMWNLCEGNSNESVANEKVMEMLSNASNGEKEKNNGGGA